MRAVQRLRVLGILLAALATAGCTEPVDLTTGVELLDVSTGWHDAGVVNGQNKIVPSISFKLRNASDQNLVVLQANAIFRQLTETEEWGSGFATIVGGEGLPPGATSDVVTLHSTRGYTGTDPISEMLNNSQFVDAKVNLFAKYGSVAWTPVGEVAIERRLIPR
jgi:hypothetical protein